MIYTDVQTSPCVSANTLTSPSRIEQTRAQIFTPQLVFGTENIEKAEVEKENFLKAKVSLHPPVSSRSI
jgi:hypothetical protein